MTRYEFFGNLLKYKDSLQHAQSKLYGTQRDDVKYYKREGKPGNYTYYYTKAQWDAAQEAKKRDEWEKQQKAKQATPQNSANKDAADAEAKARAEYERKKMYEGLAEKARKHNKDLERKENYEKNMNSKEEAINKSMASNKPEVIEKNYDESKLHEINIDTSYPTKAEVDEKMKKEQEERNKKEGHDETKINEINIDTSYPTNKEIDNKHKEAKEKELKAKREAIIKENTEILQNDPDSFLNKAKDINSFMNDIDARTELAKNGELAFKLLEQDIEIRQIYQDIAENKETEEIDPKTGLHIKNYDIPIEDEIKLVNPAYYMSDQEYVSGQMYGPTGYANNCYACTQAMVLREKGYDVNAGFDTNGISYAYDEYGNLLNMADPELGTSFNDLWTGSYTKIDYYENTKAHIDREPAGSYGDYNILVQNSRGEDVIGHSIFYKVDSSGKVHYYDCQNGQEYSEKQMKEFGELAGRGGHYYSFYKRLDNQTFKGNALVKKGKVGNKTIKEGILNESK